MGGDNYEGCDGKGDQDLDQGESERRLERALFSVL